MAKPKGENTKGISIYHFLVTAAKAKKATVEAQKDQAKQAEKQKQEDLDWSHGGKKPGKAEEKAQKEVEKKQRKMELENLKRLDEEEIAKIKPHTKSQKLKSDFQPGKSKTPEYSATNIDDALDLLSITTPNSNDKIERHPERRVKAALAAYEDREIPKLRQENPGLKLSQIKQIVYKNWQRAPENPFNQLSVKFDSKREDEAGLLEQRKMEIENRLKEH